MEGRQHRARLFFLSTPALVGISDLLAPERNRRSWPETDCKACPQGRGWGI